jgi:hypothetical protein
VVPFKDSVSISRSHRVNYRPIPSALRPGPSLIRFLKTHTWIHFIGLAGLYAAHWTVMDWVYGFLLPWFSAYRTQWTDLDWGMKSGSLIAMIGLLSIVLPALQSTVVTSVSLLLPRRRRDDLTWQPDLRPLGCLRICIVSKGANQAALRRSYAAIAPLIDDRMRLDIVTDLAVDLPHIRVPDDFQPRHARFKARALEYYRKVSRFGKHDWVLHLDEETVVDAACLEACILHCRRSPHWMGQGIIFYNNHLFWQHSLLAVADCIRTPEDMAKFFAQYAWLNRPIFGVHGAFFLVKGSLEDEIGWDWPEWLTEDYTFSWLAMKKGYKCGFIDGFAWEQSPQTVFDFLKQRRRWVVGIRQLSGQSAWAAYWVTLWQMAPLGRIAGFILAILTFVPLWIAVPCRAVFVTNLYIYLLGAFVQNVDARTPALLTAARIGQTAFLYPVALLLETAGITWAIFSRAERMTFQVVRK